MIKEILSSRFALPTQTLIKSSVLKVSLFSLILVGSIVIFLVPTVQEIEKMEHQIKALETGLNENKRLLPIHKSLKEQIEILQTEIIKHDGPAAITQNQISGLSSRFKQLSKAYRINITQGQPDIDSISQGGTRIKFRLSATGSYRNFQKFLKKILKQSYVEKAAKVQINVSRKKYVKQIEMDLWIKIKGKN